MPAWYAELRIADRLRISAPELRTLPAYWRYRGEAALAAEGAARRDQQRKDARQAKRARRRHR